MARKRLGMRELESQVMEVLWSAPLPLTPGQVHDLLGEERDLAYTTVMTVLVRLWKKKLLARKREGRAYAYRPTKSREEHAAERIREILASAGNRSQALASFLQGLAPKDRAQLRRLLQERRRK